MHYAIHRLRRQQQSGIFLRFLSNLSKTKFHPKSSPCPECCQLLVNRKHTMLHFIRHYLARCFICSLCKSRFTCALLLSRHIKHKHSGVKTLLKILFFDTLPKGIIQRFTESLHLTAQENKVNSKAINNEIINPPDSFNGTAELPITEEFLQTENNIYNFSHNLEQTDTSWLVPGATNDEARILVVSKDISSTDDINAPILVSNPISNSGQPMMYEPTVYGIQPGELYILQSEGVGSELVEGNIFCSETVNYVHEPNPFSQVPAYEADMDYQATDFVTSVDYGSTGFNEQLHQPQSGLQIAEDWFACTLCPARFSTSMDLQHHANLPHQTTRLLVCATCGVSKTDLTDTQPCLICGLATNFQEVEAIIEVDKQQPRYACGHCAAAFTEISQLEAHMTELMTEAAAAQIQNMTDVTNNNNQVDTTINSQPASSVRSRRALTLARRKHPLQLSEEEIQKLICTQPTNATSVSERLLIEAACERNTVSYPRELRQASSSITHKSCSQKKSSSSTSVCPVCSHCFGRAADLRRHMYLHTGVRPHGCDFCHKRFILRHRLLRHLLNEHGSEGRTIALRALSRNRKKNRTPINVDPVTTYTCHVCGLQCRTRPGLRGHVRSHTNTNIYVCSRCGRLFRTPMQRKRHLLNCRHQQQLLQTPPRVFTVASAVPDTEGMEEPVFDLANYFLTLPPPGEEDDLGYKDLLMTESVPFECVNLDEVVIPPLPTSSKLLPVKPKRRRGYVKVGGQKQSDRVDSYCTLGSQCKRCHVIFPSERAFQHHSCGPSTSASTSFNCAGCGKTFPTLKELRRHSNTHMRNTLHSEQPVGCTQKDSFQQAPAPASIRCSKHCIERKNSSAYRQKSSPLRRG